MRSGQILNGIFGTGRPYGEVGHVSQKHIDLDHLGNLGTGLLEDGLEVADAGSSLLLDGALDEVALSVTRDLAGAVDGSRGLDGLGLPAASGHEPN
jgi:hypothetical protein